MKRRVNERRGFTIVELLIVIVVIAILAAISIVAYNGIQERANNAQRVLAAQQWIKSLKSYTTINQTYPATLGWYCIGESNITNFDGNPDVDCGVSNNIKHNATIETPAFNAELKKISTLPQFPGKPVQLDSNLSGSGMLLRPETYDPTGENIPNVPTLIFFLEGPNQDCVVGPLVTPYAGGNFVKTTAKNSYSNIGTACRVMLENPSKL
jgi:prepilin-type N-terminal cleavage/methylation domain-containing protein